MPPSVYGLHAEAKAKTIQFTSAPVSNTLLSMMLLNEVEDISGLSTFLQETYFQLTPAERETHKVVTDGLIMTYLPDKPYPSFPAFLEVLKARPAVQYQENFLRHLSRMTADKMLLPPEQARPIEAGTVLASFETYLQYLTQVFEKDVCIEVEEKTFPYLQDPQALKDHVIAHLEMMWERFFSAQWEKDLPLIEKAVATLQQVDFGHLEPLEIVRRITSRELSDELWKRTLDASQDLLIVPNTHLGPYVSLIHYGEALLLFVGAQLSPGIHSVSPELSRRDLYIRLNALTDETRLEIVEMVRKNGEMCSQEIMQALDISQSTTSRHLTQLVASGFLVERRNDGAKCYHLGEKRAQETLQALSQALLGKKLHFTK